MLNGLHFEKFRDAAGLFRWRLRAANGRIVADSAEGYSAAVDRDHGIELIVGVTAQTPVRDVDHKPAEAVDVVADKPAADVGAANHDQAQPGRGDLPAAG